MGIVTGPGGPQAFSSASGGKVYAFNNISTAPLVVVAANTSRQKITFHNPSDVDIFVGPSTVLNAAGSSVALVPAVATPGGCFVVFANGGTLVVEGECQGAWQAFSRTSNTKALTVMDSNV